MDQFYLTLPSNSSMDYYPQNTVANYITHLSRPVQLSGAWEVSLVELHYPCSFSSSEESSVIKINAFREQPATLAALQLALSSDVKTVSGESNTKTPQIVEAYTIVEPLPKKINYQDVQEIIDFINKHPVLAKHITFAYDPETKKIELKPRNHVTKVEIPQRLALQLGLDPSETDYKTNNKAIRPVNLRLGDRKSVV